MCASLAPELLDGFYSCSVFKSLSILGRCPVNLNIPYPKQAISRWAPAKNRDFIENRLNDSDSISVVHGDHIPN
jgi:hypothetical protein